MNAAFGRSEMEHGHAALMDSVYRWQKHIYDVTRKYYLFGRDRLIAELDLAPGQSVLEIACGTGRNLARIARVWPQARLLGLDISTEMLGMARRRLGDEARLATADATTFTPQDSFGENAFDRIVISYALSMIPDWQVAMTRAAGMLAPGGSLLIVDFGDFGGLPRPLRSLLRVWLARFHVRPRGDLLASAQMAALRHDLVLESQRGAFGYYRLIRLRRTIYTTD